MKFTLPLLAVVLSACSPAVDAAFNRISTFFPCSQIIANCNTNQVTNAEIVAASEDGNLLIYTDPEFGKVGFVNIADPANPLPAGIVDFLPGIPNSVAVRGRYALAVIATSVSFANPSGYLAVIDIISRAIVRNITLPGQADSIVTFGSIAAIAMENERNENLAGTGPFNNGTGLLPQLPAGSVVIVNTTSSNPADWTTINVDVTGLPNVNFNTDPEPEYVAINSKGVIAVTLQENNAVVLINGTSGAVITSYSLGTTGLTEIDTLRESTTTNLILQVNSTSNIERQSDGIAWIDDRYFATADEGDIGTGGSRTFTIFDSTNGAVVYSPASFLEHLTVSIGHYPNQRSNSKGNEPETVLVATFSGQRLLFVVTERSNNVFVYDATNPVNPVFLQVLACSTSGPEGIVAIPSRNLLATANEVDSRIAGKFRSSISIYQNSAAPPSYPVLISQKRTANTFIPFSALSSLAASPPFGSALPGTTTTLYTVEDSFYLQNRILTIEVTPSGPPYLVKTELRIRDNSNVLFNLLNSTFPAVTGRINSDKTVNIDPEGISISLTDTNTVWVASEGAGTSTTPNLLLRVSLTDGNIVSAISLPANVNAIQINNGFEGCAEYGNWVVVAFQRPWTGETLTRIGLYNYVLNTWKFVFYPPEPYVSPIAVGFTGLSEVSTIGNGRFLILERDSNGGPDASIKRLYEINLGADLSLIAENTTITKTLVLDMMPILATKFGLMPEKVEGVAIDSAGGVWVNNDNDGVLNNAGEQQLVFMGALYAAEVPSASPSAAPKKAPVTAPVVVPIPVPVVVPVPVAPVAPVTPPVAPVAPVTPPVAPVAPVTPPVAPPAPIAPPVPVKVPSAPVKAPTKVPVKTPTANTTAPVVVPTPPPVREPCGLLNLNIFCPFTQCGLLGRLFGLCDE